MIHKFNKILYSFYAWQFEYYEPKTIKKYTHKVLWYIINTLTLLVVIMLPYGFTHFVWYRILIYMTNYKYIPINLLKLDDNLQKDIPDWSEIYDIFGYYEIIELDQ